MFKVIIGLGLLGAVEAEGSIRLPAIISDNMVLQANRPVPIWGTAEAGESVTVDFAGQTQKTTADSSGKWRVNLAPLKTDTAGDMTVTGTTSLTIKNVLTGEVWVASGQSNMQFTLGGADNAWKDIAEANYPKIRQFRVVQRAALDTREDVTGEWVECSPQTAGGFTAVGFFFARDIRQQTGSPVGLIHTSWGATAAQAWTSLEGLKKDPLLAHYVKAFDPDAVRRKYARDLAAWHSVDAKWKAEMKADAGYQVQLATWQSASDEAKTAGKPSPEQPKPPKAEPEPPAPIEHQAAIPSSLYNGMIHPLIPYAIRGAIWYQGESNESAAVEYRTLFPTMIADWREKWRQGDFPFYFVQLANFRKRQDHPSDGLWAWVREAQAITLKVPHTGMAVTIDVGSADQIHPTDKYDVGHRLALHALKNDYGKDVVDNGPMFKQMQVRDGRIRLSFTEIGKGLTIGRPQKPEAELTGFAVAGNNRKWFWAKATIDGANVVVWCDEVRYPVAVRYAWADNPACNLYNLDGLPAAPFRTDNWPMEIAKK
jgi:sialate O-acetylesterase